MAYSSLGASLPDLQVSATAGPVASWGSPLSLSIRILNTGASTMVEPLSQVPTSELTVGPDGQTVPPFAIPSSADAPPSVMGVYLTRRPRSMAGAIQIGTISVPSVSQNSIDSIETSVTLPAHPVRFPLGGRLYIRLIANNDQGILESNYANNQSAPIPVRVTNRSAPLLTATALDVPPVMQPGDTIAPTIQITNLGTAGTSSQGPVEVALVASTTPDFNLGSSIVALYTITDDIPGASAATTGLTGRRHGRVLGSSFNAENVTPGSNTFTLNGAPVTLPTSPSLYFIGVVIDPNNRLNQLSVPANRLQLIRVVGPSNSGLPPAGVVSSALTAQFPNPPDGQPIGLVNPATL
jgi:hypothetical protein